MIYIPVFLVAAAAVLVINTLRFRKKTRTFIEPLPYELSEEAVDKLKRAVSLKTVSHSDYSLNDLSEFGKIIPFIKESYPLLVQNLAVESLNEYSCFLRWTGSDESLKPVLLIAHFDVVPVEGQNWSVDPFAGEEKDGFIWGRGTLDTKNTMTAMLESAELLMKEGFKPRRSVYMAFGGDEETQGTEGAGSLNRYFREKGIEFEWLLDEGGVVAEGALSLVEEPLALIGISEKGYLNVSITARGTGGHSSMPPRHSAAGLIGRAVARVEDNPFPPRLTPTVCSFLRGITPYVSFPAAVILSNLFLFSSVIKKLFLQGNQTAALIRTTQAVTILRAGEKENVLPSSGEAVVNLRILPGETVQTSLSRLKKVLKGCDVEVGFLNDRDANDPIEESPVDHEGYALLGSVIHGVFPEAVTVPYMMTGATDSKHYRGVCSPIYRFAPMKLDSSELALIHSADERISRENYEKAIRFYMTLINKL